jgi:hypothetical protein
MNSPSQNIFFTGHIQPAIAASGRKKQGPSAVFTAVFCGQAVVVAVAVDADRILGLQQFSSKALYLLANSPGKIFTRDTVRKPWNVIQPLGCGGLAAQRRSLDYKRVDALPGCVKGCG